MSRHARFIIPAILLTSSLFMSGCKTVYSDIYSPRRNHFVRVKDKPKPEPVAPVVEPQPAGTDLPGLGLPPAAPPSAPAMPDAGAPSPIPGL